jgi:hypothetical protein
MKTSTLFAVCIMLLLIYSCNKDSSKETGDNLLTNAFNYEGDYPEHAIVTFTDQGVAVGIEAYPGMVTVFFKPSVTEEQSSTIISDLGGTVLSKIPSVGYYLVEVGISSVGGFINAMQSESKVEYACPNVVSHYCGNAIILDGCGSGIPFIEEHAKRVALNFGGCGGKAESCSNISSNYGAPVVDLILHSFMQAIQNTKTGNILINISSSGGYGDGSWSNQNNEEQQKALLDWYYFMRNILKIIGSLDESYRSRLIVTVASGNGDMPISGMIKQLRINPMYSEVLDENVLIVSNKAKASDAGYGNYAEEDPDVVVLDNPDAYEGTSFAAPCALGIIQDILETMGVSTAEALEAVKMASLVNEDRFVSPDEAMAMLDIIHGKTEYKGSSTLLSFQVETGPCIGQINFTNLPSIYWNESQGVLMMPSDCKVTIISGDNCFVNGSDHDAQTFQVNLSGTNTNFTGTGTQTFNIGSGGVPITVSFTGAVNIYGDVTGTLIMTAVGVQSANITLIKQ